MKVLFSVLLSSGTVELQTETPHDRDSVARIGMVVDGSQLWLTDHNARALCSGLRHALELVKDDAE